MDVGAEFGNYASDLTRTVPVSGKFNPRQRSVYEAVLRVENAAISLLKPGVLIKEYQQEVGKVMSDELMKFGLLDQKSLVNQDPDKPAYKKYFMHRTSHHLGLDTHDYGPMDAPLQAHMVLTVEPGIYIPEEGFGIRIEDNVVIQPQGPPLVLTRNIPKDPDEIETLILGFKMLMSNSSLREISKPLAMRIKVLKVGFVSPNSILRNADSSMSNKSLNSAWVNWRSFLNQQFSNPILQLKFYRSFPRNLN